MTLAERRRGRSIATTITVGLLSLITVLLTISGVIAYRTYAASQWRTLHSNHRTIADQLAASLASPLWNFDRPTLTKIAEGVFQFPAAAGICIRNADDGSIVHARQRDAQWHDVSTEHEPLAPDSFVEKRPITFGGETIGSLELFASPHVVEATLRSALIAVLSGIAGLDLALVLGLYLLLRRVVLQPLQQIESYALALSSGDPADKLVQSPLRGEMASLHASQRNAYLQLGQLNRRLEAVKDEERRLLSRELHDEMGQTLTALKLRLRLLGRAGAAVDGAGVDELIGLVDRLIERVRKVSVDLRPPLLDELGLESALGAFFDAQVAHTSTVLTLQTSGIAQRFAPEIEMACFRIVQEAVTNIERHSGAQRAQTHVAYEDGRLRLLITDDGRGVSPEDALSKARAGHLGIVGMRERARALGGEFLLSSPPTGGASGGTRIDVTLPASPLPPS